MRVRTLHQRVSLRLQTLIAAVVLTGTVGGAHADVPIVRTTLDSAGDVGRWSDLVVRADGTALVAYSSTTDASLKVASCGNPSCTAAAIATLDIGGPFAHVAVALSAEDRAAIAYQHPATGTVKLALCADAACASATIRTVDDPGALSNGLGITVGADGRPVVVYAEAGGSGATLAHCDDAACTTSTSTPFPGEAAAEEPDVVTGADGLPLFAYREGIDLVIGHCTVAACTSATFLRLEGSAGPFFTYHYESPALQLASDGLVQIAAVVYSVDPPPFPAVRRDLFHFRCGNAACTSIPAQNQTFGILNAYAPALARRGDLPVVASYSHTGPHLRVKRCRTVTCGDFYGFVDLDVTGVGQEPSVGLAAGDVMLVSYYDDTGGDLEIAAVPPFSEIYPGGNISVPEGTGTNPTATFTVTRSEVGSGQAVTVGYATGPVTAQSGIDFVPASGTVTFAPGELSRTVGVEIVGDALDEPDEFFHLVFQNPQGAEIIVVHDPSCFIVDDDATQPPVSINGTSLVEGDSGNTAATLQVSFAGTAGATVAWETRTDTATSGVDFVPASGVLTFAPGETTKTVQVEIIGDTLLENDEIASVRLFDAQGASIPFAFGSVQIVNDDGPRLSIADLAVGEKDAGASPVQFTISFDTPSPQITRFRYVTQPITATANWDFSTTSGMLVVPAGTSSVTVAVPILGDTLVETDETFRVRLSDIFGGVLLDPEAVATILDDDEPAVLGELRHGTSYVGELATHASGPDLDDFPFVQQPYASYEVVIDGVSGDARPLQLERRGSGGSVLQTGAPVGTGGSVGMRWRVAANAPVTDETVRVAGACGTGCGRDDLYRVRTYETTLRAPRFNNAGGQTTILVLHNAGDSPLAAAVALWAPDGELLAQHTPTGPIAPRGTLVLDTSAIAPDASGSLTVAHDGAYGTLSGKAVALDPATGLAFDTPLEPRTR
jgi:hypothetical protein